MGQPEQLPCRCDCPKSARLDGHATGNGGFHPCVVAEDHRLGKTEAGTLAGIQFGHLACAAEGVREATIAGQQAVLQAGDVDPDWKCAVIHPPNLVADVHRQVGGHHFVLKFDLVDDRRSRRLRQARASDEQSRHRCCMNDGFHFYPPSEHGGCA